MAPRLASVERIALHAARLVEHEDDVGRLLGAGATPRAARRASRRRGPRAGSAAVADRRRAPASIGAPILIAGSTGRNPSAIARSCCGLRLEERRGALPAAVALVGLDPVGVEHAVRVIGPERALDRIDRDQVGARAAWRTTRSPGSRTAPRPTGSSGRARSSCRRRTRSTCRSGRSRPRRRAMNGSTFGSAAAVRPRVVFAPAYAIASTDEQARVRVLGVGVAELHRAPLGVPELAPAPGIAADREDVGPADRLLRPAERLGHRLPHRDHDRRQHERLARPARSAWCGCRATARPDRAA